MYVLPLRTEYCPQWMWNWFLVVQHWQRESKRVDEFLLSRVSSWKFPWKLHTDTDRQHSFNLPTSSPTPHCPSAPCAGYQWLLESDLKHWYLATMQRMAQAHPIWRTRSKHTPQPVHYALLLPIDLLLRHFGGSSLPLNKITTVCCPASTMVKQTHVM